MTDGFALSYLALRRAVGVIGILLPPVLLTGEQLLQGGDLPGSISAYYYYYYYYYPDMRDVLVGSLCAIGVFLISYRFSRIDNILSSLAGAFAITSFGGRRARRSATPR